MPAGTLPDKAVPAVQNLCRKEFVLKYRYAMALHTDEPHPHVHVVIKAVSEQGGAVTHSESDTSRVAGRICTAPSGIGVPANGTQRADAVTIRLMGTALDQYGVVGHPVGHSLSPFIHGMFARETGQKISYRLYDVAPGEFHARVRAFFAQGGRGLNVTLPHKIVAVDVAHELTPRAAHAAAVNTLAARADGNTAPM